MKKVIVCLYAASMLGGMVYGASLRPGGDPPADKTIWADPFDNYSQWAWDNRANPAYSRGTMWQGGPIPAGSASGGLPAKTISGGTGCEVSIQTTPSWNEMFYTQWLHNDCPSFDTVPWGGNVYGVETAYADVAKDPNCGGTGEIVETKPMYARLNYCWGTGGSYTSMPQVTHDFSDRISAYVANLGLQGLRNAVNGTDANPLVLVVYMGGEAQISNIFNNMYVELAFGDDAAPTDYIWRGKQTTTIPGDPEYCPQGPYPVITQQAREINLSVSEDGGDLVYLNTHAPALSTKIWKSFAFGFMALIDKDPCGVAEQGVDAHIPTADHMAVFDGNIWRQLRSGRFNGLASPQPVNLLPFPPDTSMSVDTGSAGGGFVVGAATHKVYMKIVTDYVLLYMVNDITPNNWYAAIPRAYKGGFNKIRLGVAAGSQVISVNGGNWADGTRTLTMTSSNPTLSPDAGAFTNYNWVTGDTIELTSGTGVTLGTYTVASKTNNDSIVLTGDINGAGGDIADGTVVGLIKRNARCLSYSRMAPEGYLRTRVDSMVMYAAGTNIDENFVYVDTVNGACCNPQTQVCTMSSQAACIADPTNVWNGVGSTCSTVRCCRPQYGDFDGDADVDMGDFALLQQCLTIPAGTAIQAGCECMDYAPTGAGDGKVNATDVERFAACAKGTGIAPNVNCN